LVWQRPVWAKISFGYTFGEDSAESSPSQVRFMSKSIYGMSRRISSKTGTVLGRRADGMFTESSANPILHLALEADWN